MCIYLCTSGTSGSQNNVFITGVFLLCLNVHIILTFEKHTCRDLCLDVLLLVFCVRAQHETVSEWEAEKNERVKWSARARGARRGLRVLQQGWLCVSSGNTNDDELNTWETIWRSKISHQAVLCFFMLVPHTAWSFRVASSHPTNRISLQLYSPSLTAWGSSCLEKGLARDQSGQFRYVMCIAWWGKRILRLMVGFSKSCITSCEGWSALVWQLCWTVQACSVIRIETSVALSCSLSRVLVPSNTDSHSTRYNTLDGSQPR